MSEQITSIFYESMATILPALIGIVVTLLGVVGTYLSTKLSKYFTAKAEAVEVTKKNEIIGNALKRFEGLVLTVITSTNQTIVDPLRKATADGVLTDDEKTMIFNTAREQIQAQMTTEMSDALTATYADVEAYITHLMEQTVNDLKKKVITAETNVTE